ASVPISIHASTSAAMRSRRASTSCTTIPGATSSPTTRPRLDSPCGTGPQRRSALQARCMNRDPIDLFLELQALASKTEPHAATAMTLATSDARGRPSARMVLLKGADARGFTFYTNFESRKARELAENPYAALCFHWPTIERQVRIEGGVVRVDDAESD